jgi:hypothetical protein
MKIFLTDLLRYFFSSERSTVRQEIGFRPSADRLAAI